MVRSVNSSTLLTHPIVTCVHFFPPRVFLVCCFLFPTTERGRTGCQFWGAPKWFVSHHSWRWLLLADPNVCRSYSRNYTGWCLGDAALVAKRAGASICLSWPFSVPCFSHPVGSPVLHDYCASPSLRSILLFESATNQWFLSSGYSSSLHFIHTSRWALLLMTVGLILTFLDGFFHVAWKR